VQMDKAFNKDGTPRGLGNQVSVEFNFAYRWHSAIGREDENWTHDMYQSIFNKPGEEISLEELTTGLGRWEHALSDDPMKRPFANLQRGSNGKYNDDDLVQIMTNAIEDVAGESKITYLGGTTMALIKDD
jgi:hypothetical protein